MPAFNVKVVLVLPGWWRIVALFGAGGGLSVVHYGLGQTLPLLAEHVALVFVVLIIGGLVPLSFSEQRLRRSCFEAVAIGTGVTVGHCVLVLWAAGVWADPVRATPAFSVINTFYGLVAVLMCLVIRLVGLWVVRSFICHLLVQSGSLCWTCGYDLTGNESGVCPECGTAIAAAGRSRSRTPV